MLGQRRRRWPNIKPLLVQCPALDVLDLWGIQEQTLDLIARPAELILSPAWLSRPACRSRQVCFLLLENNSRESRPNMYDYYL